MKRTMIPPISYRSWSRTRGMYVGSGFSGIISWSGSFTFLLRQLDSWLSTLGLSMDTECPVAQQWFPTPVGLSRFVSSLNL